MLEPFRNHSVQGGSIADLIFENPRLVSIYDFFDGTRADLDHYVSIIKELGAQSVLDIGSGTGCLASRLVEQGLKVIGVEPAKASLDFAKQKIKSEQVQWVFGDASSLPPLRADLAIMTGNVAQVFLTDQSWHEALLNIRKSLTPNGHLVFEVRNPAKKDWLEWTREKTYQRINIPNVGYIEEWYDLLDVSKDLVSFQWTCIFESDGQTLVSKSVLRFREREEIEASLKKTGFKLKQLRDAPDRPGQEFVFIATV